MKLSDTERKKKVRSNEGREGGKERREVADKQSG